MFQSESEYVSFSIFIYIEGYSIVRCDRDRKGGGVACYIKNEICFSTKNILSKKIEVIFAGFLLQKTNVISVGIVYRPPNDTIFLQLFAEILNSLNILENEIFVFGYMNINILQNGINLLEKNPVNTSKGKNVISSNVKNYIEFCSTMGLKQLIKVPTTITSNISTLIDHILTSTSEKVIQAGIIETSLSDHQLIFCTRKIKRAKPNKHNYLTFCAKNFSTEIYEDAPGKLTFPDYESFGCVNNAYSDLA